MRVKPPFWGFWAKMALFRAPRGPPGEGFTSTPPRGPGGGPRALKGPRRGPGVPEGSRIPDPGISDPGVSRIPGGVPPPPGGRGLRSPGDRVRTPIREGFYINPSRRGPAVPAGGPGDRGSRGALPGTSPGGLRPPLPEEGVSATPRGSRRGWVPRRGLEGSPLLLPEEGSSSHGRWPRPSPSPVY